MASTESLPELGSLEPNAHGYRDFALGEFAFTRDEYFARIAWPYRMASRRPSAGGKTSSTTSTPPLS